MTRCMPRRGRWPPLMRRARRSRSRPPSRRSTSAWRPTWQPASSTSASPLPACSQPRTPGPGCAASWRMGQARRVSAADEPANGDAAAMTEPMVPAEQGGSPSLDMVTAALRADSSDIAIYARVLTESLGDSLPPNCVTVERDRSVSDRMKGRPGMVTKITVRLGDQVMTLGLKGGAPAAEICREVRGVVLSRQPVQIAEWAVELAKALVGYADQNAATADALRRLVAGG